MELLKRYEEDYLNNYEDFDIEDFLSNIWVNMSDNIKKEYIKKVISFIKSERNRESYFTVSERLKDGSEPVYSKLLGIEFKDEDDKNLYICSDDYGYETNMDVIAFKMELQRDLDCGIDYLSEKDFESWDKLGSIIFDF